MSRSSAGHSSCTTETTMALLVEGERPLVRARFEFRSDEPFGVRMELSLDDGSSVEWIIARELLIQGVHAPAGLADVQLYPISDAVVIELDSPDGGATLLADPEALADFAVEMEALVPLGCEDEFYSLDEALESVLAIGVPRTTEA